jgi:hypothetical protein
MNNSVADILMKLENADNKSKNALENELVNYGEKAIPELVKNLSVVTGSVRGVVAMTLIRIGNSSIDFLKKAAASNKDLEWVVDYLITEINNKVA